MTAASGQVRNRYAASLSRASRSSPRRWMMNAKSKSNRNKKTRNQRNQNDKRTSSANSVVTLRAGCADPREYISLTVPPLVPFVGQRIEEGKGKKTRSCRYSSQFRVHIGNKGRMIEGADVGGCDDGGGGGGWLWWWYKVDKTGVQRLCKRGEDGRPQRGCECVMRMCGLRTHNTQQKQQARG